MRYSALERAKGVMDWAANLRRRCNGLGIAETKRVVTLQPGMALGRFCGLCTIFCVVCGTIRHTIGGLRPNRRHLPPAPRPNSIHLPQFAAQKIPPSVAVAALRPNSLHHRSIVCGPIHCTFDALRPNSLHLEASSEPNPVKLAAFSIRGPRFGVAAQFTTPCSRFAAQWLTPSTRELESPRISHASPWSRLGRLPALP